MRKLSVVAALFALVIMTIPVSGASASQPYSRQSKHNCKHSGKKHRCKRKTRKKSGCQPNGCAVTKCTVNGKPVNCNEHVVVPKSTCETPTGNICQPQVIKDLPPACQYIPNEPCNTTEYVPEPGSCENEPNPGECSTPNPVMGNGPPVVPCAEKICEPPPQEECPEKAQEEAVGPKG